MLYQSKYVVTNGHNILVTPPTERWILFLHELQTQPMSWVCNFFDQ